MRPIPLPLKGPGFIGCYTTFHPSAAGLPEGVATAELPAGTREGVNDWHRTGYGGPCPPVGNHRYFHKLYALDTVLPDLNRPTKAELEKAMHDHIIGQTELIGRYQKQRSDTVLSITRSIIMDIRNLIQFNMSKTMPTE